MSGPAWSLEGAELVADYVARRTGLVFAPHRRPELERALRSLFDPVEPPNWRAVPERLAAEPALWERLLDQVTVGETYFFREPQHFEFVRREVLPQVLALRGARHGFRVWSAGCSTGEEVYSLAIVLREHGLLSNASVLGTDLSQSALERAREGRYRAWSLRNTDPDALAPYFESHAGTHRVRDELRDYVEFELLNLAEPCYPSPLDGTSQVDLIFCRNVFIYLRAETIGEITRRFYQALAPGGFLVMGPSDPLLPDERFELLTTPGGIVYRRPTAAPSLRPAIAPEFRSERGALPARSRSCTPRPRRRTPELVPAPKPAFDEPRALAEIRALSNRSGAARAERACREALEASPLSVELHYLMGLLLLELDDVEGAIAALRRVLYLDGSLAIAHYTLGRLLARAGERRGAERAYRNAEHFAAARAEDEAVPLSDGLTARGLAQAARRELSNAGGVER